MFSASRGSTTSLTNTLFSALKLATWEAKAREIEVDHEQRTTIKLLDLMLCTKNRMDKMEKDQEEVMLIVWNVIS